MKSENGQGQKQSKLTEYVDNFIITESEVIVRGCLDKKKNDADFEKAKQIAKEKRIPIVSISLRHIPEEFRW